MKNKEILTLLNKVLASDELSNIELDLAKKLTLELYQNLLMNEVAGSDNTQEFEKTAAGNDEQVIINEPIAKEPAYDKEDEVVGENDTVRVEEFVKEDEIAVDSEPAEVEEPVKEEKVTEVTEIKEEEKKEEVSEVVEQEKEISHTSSHGKTISDKLQETAKATLYDMISSIKSDEDLSTKLANMPLDNITKAITLNEKMKYTKELFGGSMDKYNEAISRINAANSLEEALDIIAKYHIDTTKDCAGEFIRVVYRRFIQN